MKLDWTLECYEKRINKQYKDEEYKKYFIFLTIDLEEPFKENWMKANHQMVTDVIKEILQIKKDISTKTRIVLESYIDLLKRNRIVADTDLKKLCEKIWNDEKYKNAFEIIINYRPNKMDEISKIINNYDDIEIIKEKKYKSGQTQNILFSFKGCETLVYLIKYSADRRLIEFTILANKTSEDETLAFPTSVEIVKKKYDLEERGLRLGGYVGLSASYYRVCLDSDEFWQEELKKYLQGMKDISTKYN